MKTLTKQNLKLYNQIDKHLSGIEKAIEHLEDLGDIKCSIKGCGDVGCASVVVHLAVLEARLKIYKLLGGKVVKVKPKMVKI